MKQYDNPHAARLAAAIAGQANDDIAGEILAGIPLAKSPSPNAGIKWAGDMCEALAARFDSGSVAAIRQNCACGPSASKIKKLKAKYSSGGALAALAEVMTEDGAPSWAEDDVLYMTYPRCYCSLVNRSDAPLPREWCYCSLGYARRLAEGATGRAATAELIESVKQGDARCLIAIRFEE